MVFLNWMIERRAFLRVVVSISVVFHALWL